MDIKAFFAENNTQQTHKIAISQRFKDKNANPIEWEIRPLGEKEVDAIRKSCIINVKSKIGTRKEVNRDAVQAKLNAAAVVYPNLKDPDLLASYKAVGPDDLLQTMLHFGEYARLSLFVSEISGMSLDEDEAIDDIKN